MEGLDDELANRLIPGAPHTIYADLWHVTFWQQISLDGEWAGDRLSAESAGGFPDDGKGPRESRDQLRQCFLQGTEEAAAVSRDSSRLEKSIRCTSPPGRPIRSMSVREQLESLAAHNTYHLGRIVLLRQLSGAWPPPAQ